MNPFPGRTAGAKKSLGAWIRAAVEGAISGALLGCWALFLAPFLPKAVGIGLVCIWALLGASLGWVDARRPFTRGRGEKADPRTGTEKLLARLLVGIPFVAGGASVCWWAWNNVVQALVMVVVLAVFLLLIAALLQFVEVKERPVIREEWLEPFQPRQGGESVVERDQVRANHLEDRQ
jgi:hypothetical protein